MSTLLCLLVLPPLADLGRFRGAYQCQQQAGLCHEHEARLRYLRGVRGHDGGRWDEALARTRWQRRYWEALVRAHESFGVGPLPRRQALRDLLEALGPECYRAGWSPPAITAAPDPWLAAPGVAGNAAGGNP